MPFKNEIMKIVLLFQLNNSLKSKVIQYENVAKSRFYLHFQKCKDNKKD